MDLFTGIATYIIIWWTVLFAVLPIGVRSQEEAGDVAVGSERAAPAEPNLGRKLRTTTIVAAGFWLVVFVVIQFGLIEVPDRRWEF